MTMFQKTKLFTACALTVGLSACGGSGSTTATDSSNNGTTPIITSTLITGVAASGAPIIGTIQITDAKGTQKKVNTAADGSYSIDTLGLTAPFVLLADGYVGSKKVSYYAPATVEDIGKNLINITPLSDLMLANIAGDLAINCAASTACVNALTKAKIDTSVTDLAAKLAPVLKNMGLDASTDLLHTSFTAGSSKGVDALLDVLSVTIDTATKVATIKNLASGTSTTDDMTTSTDNATPIASSTIVTVEASTAAQVKARVEEIATILDSTDSEATKISKLKALCTSDFLDGGLNCNDAASDWVSHMEGVYLLSVFRQIGTFDASQPNQLDDSKTPTDQTIASRFQDYGGGKTILWRKGSDGKFYMAGDQRIADVSLMPRADYQPKNTAGSFSSFIQIDINPGSDASGNLLVDSAVVTGPGLPTAGIKFIPHQNDHWFKRADMVSGNWNGVNDKEVDLSVVATGVANKTPYVFTLYKGANVVAMYKENLSAAPIASSALTVAMFPNISNLPTVSLCQTGGTWIANWALPTGYKINELRVECYGNGGSRAVNNSHTTASFSGVATDTGIGVEYGAHDQLGRTFWINQW